MYEFVYGFPPLQQSLEKLSTLEELQFEVLRKEVASPKGFTRSLERCEKIAGGLRSKLTPRDIFNILASLSFLYDNSRRWEKAEHNSHDGLHEFLEFTGLNQSLGKLGSTFFEKLRHLIAVNPAVERRRKRRRLKSGLVDTAIDFASFVDIRPSFTQDRSAIDELIPIVILRIAIKAEYGPNKSCVFQMSTEDVEKLQRVLSDIDEKLKTLKVDDSFNSRFEVVTVEDKDDGDD